MQLEGVEPALVQCQRLLNRFRDAGRPVIHIQHDAGAGSPYDLNDRIGAIADVVKPRAGEPVVVKNYPSSFEKTNLDEVLKEFGVEEVDARRIYDARLRKFDRARRVQSWLPRHGRRQCHGNAIASQSDWRRRLGQGFARRELDGASRYFRRCRAEPPMDLRTDRAKTKSPAQGGAFQFYDCRLLRLQPRRWN